MKFKTTIEGTKANAFLKSPFDPNEAWRPKDVHHVNGTIGGRTFRGPIENGQLKLGPAWRRDNGIEPGMEVEVILQPEGPLTDNVAPDLADALNQNETVRRFFDSLPTFYRNNYVRAIDALKKPESRARKIAETIELLRAGKREK